MADTNADITKVPRFMLREKWLGGEISGDEYTKEIYRRQHSTYPRELTDDLRDVLSMMMWNTGPIAHCLRAGGADIPHKAEIEQAHVLHWLTLFVLDHGPEWRAKADERLKEIRATINATGASPSSTHGGKNGG